VNLTGLFEAVLLSDNVFRAPNNYFVARGHSFTATRFDHAATGNDSQPAGIVLGDNAVYVGTVGKSENVNFSNGRIVNADIKLYDVTQRQSEFPTESATHRLCIV
jgi:hypothetical protein